MAGLKIGSTDIADVKIGSTQVEKVYIGSTEVWTNEVLTALFAGDSQSSTTGWTSGGSNPAYVIDGNDSTFAQYTGFSASVTSGLITVTFPAIVASEILEIRFRCKGSGGSTVNNSHTVYPTSAANGSTRPGVVSTWANFSTGISLYTVDTGLIAVDTACPGAATGTINASDFVGSSAGVLNWWAGGPRLVISMSDYNLGGTAGTNYSPMLQVKYKP